MAASLSTGLARRPDDPLAAIARDMLATITPSNRLHDSSVVTLVVDAIRQQGEDPLNCNLTVIDRVLPVGSRLRSRAWRPFARLLAAADARGALGSKGTLLLAQMQTGPTGRRCFIGEWSAYTRRLGVARGCAPAELREHFLAVLQHAGADEDELARTRAAIRRTERAAIRAQDRPERLPRHERLIRALLAAGAGSEQVALHLIEASHAGHRPSAHRWIDAVTARYLAWCAEHGVRALAPTEASLRRFSVERGDALGILPLRRLLAAVGG